MYWLMLVLGLAVLTVGATWLTNGAVAIAQRLRMSEYLIGLTILAVGTSLPELTVSAGSAAAGNADVAVGNIVGSNIFNVFVILGVCSFVAPLIFTRENIRRDIPMGIAASVILAFMILDGRISRFEGIAMLIVYIAIVAVSYRRDRKGAAHDSLPTEQPPQSEKQPEKRSDRQSDKLPDSQPDKKFSWGVSAVSIIVGLAALVYGAHLTLKSATDIARGFGISESVIAITILAGGTSLPELASSLAATLKGHFGLALGNVLGSNIANILLVLGVSASIEPLAVTGITKLDVAVMVGSSFAVLLSALVIGRRRITVYEGMAYLAVYAIYIGHLLK